MPVTPMVVDSMKPPNRALSTASMPIGTTWWTAPATGAAR